MSNRETFLKSIEALCGAYGYAPLEAKSPKMTSYVSADSGVRINYYFTTGSVTAQAARKEGEQFGKMILNEKKVLNELDFETRILMEIK